MDDATIKLKLYSWTLRNLLALKAHFLSTFPFTFSSTTIPKSGNVVQAPIYFNMKHLIYMFILNSAEPNGGAVSWGTEL